MQAFLDIIIAHFIIKLYESLTVAYHKFKSQQLKFKSISKLTPSIGSS